MNVKVLIYVLVAFVFSSCSFPSYVFVENTQRTGLNFTKGKWLLNEINSDLNYKNEIKNIVFNDFSKILGSRLSYVYDVKGLLLQKITSLNPNKDAIINIKKGTGFDYFINVNAKIINNDLNEIDLTNHQFNINKKNAVELIFEIYDLNNSEMIYSKKVYGSTIAQGNSDLNLFKNSQKLIIGCLKKVLKDINFKSLK